jgi:hypothetical protein
LKTVELVLNLHCLQKIYTFLTRACSLLDKNIVPAGRVSHLPA